VFFENGESAVRIRSYAHGHVATLLAMAEQLNVVEIINAHIPRNKQKRLPRREGLSVGQSLLLAAIGRSCRPTSKRGWARWAETTSLYLWRGKQLEALTSQHFWDQMNAIPVAAITKIERDLVQKVCTQYQIKPDLLLYDTTNFFTYIASTNTRPKLPKRGKNKQRRIDLRQISLALMVSKEHQLPLFHQVYEGSQVDVTTFNNILQSLTERLTFIFTELESLTIVYDKGNNSKKNQALVDEQRYHYIASLSPYHQRQLIAEANQAFEATVLPSGEVIKTYRVEREVWGAKRILVVYISETLRQGQARGLEQWLNKRTKVFDQLSQELLLARLAYVKATKEIQYQGSLEKFLEDLEQIRIAMIAEKAGQTPGPAQVRYQLENEALTPLEQQLIQLFNIEAKKPML